MKHAIGRNILLSVLAVITVLALFILIEQGRNFIGTSYFDSDDFGRQLSEFEDSIVPLVLAPPDKEEVKKKITVTPEEIEEYRYRYGDLQSQLDSIRHQYQSDTGEVTTETATDAVQEGASEEVTTSVQTPDETLLAERDKKLADITKNFEDDSYVENKVRAEKEAQVDAYYKSIERAKNDLLNQKEDFVYDLKNVETGEHFTNGEIRSKNAYKKEYSSKYGYLKARIVYQQVDDSWIVSDIMGNPFARFEGTIAIPESSILSGHRAYEYQYFLTNQRVFYGVLIAGILAAVAFTLLWRKNSETFRHKIWEEKYRKLPIDVKLAFFLMSILVVIITTVVLEDFVIYHDYDMQIFTFVFAVIFMAFTLYQWKWMRAGLGTIDWKGSLTYSWVKSLEGFFLKQSIGLQTLIMLIVVFFWGVGTLLVLMIPVVIIVWIPATLLIGIPVLVVLMSRTAYLNRIFVKTEEMAKGITGNEIEVKGKSAIAEHANGLNEIRNLIKSSHSEQAKSERLKTELITNVSHDLRTPLTSIITYTDLLKNPNITDEERASYIAILDKKSMRLKTLIEDLFEVSKMASGNIELDKRKVDLTQLLQQAIAEHQEDIDKSGLDYRVAIGTKPIMSYVDGQKWWRVLDNLIINTLKYALPNTRVYINLDQVAGEAVFVIKNIAKYELGNDVNELTERFKRADTSRHTDGSGLGLAIAQSIVDLHGGSLRMEVDGDLFKVTVKIGII
ncbi:MFS domain-containing histidine kinase [Psychrobacillus sp. OK032]|uniref:MFS domain-containing histidine kinase n=1 Tax=Psychrobacillus sp. OK032 TaxID=1884358 RepID=UPI0008ABE1A0|nr:MFS domain-containing histidine kinase [Psychrobacillus sp. OK032]SES24435.1 Signal transduction histidine kinase [Psychrobacillus sp. OK032]